ncbi:hypothetical protein JB92DRAFT_2838575 [Gautieria morchelliformis]|nr:hypothetical protein JB92DRAFT_2838575 [Gautieria morchelliformis]
MLSALSLKPGTISGRNSFFSTVRGCLDGCEPGGLDGFFRGYEGLVFGRVRLRVCDEELFLGHQRCDLRVEICCRTAAGLGGVAAAAAADACGWGCALWLGPWGRGRPLCWWRLLLGSGAREWVVVISWLGPDALMRGLLLVPVAWGCCVIGGVGGGASLRFRPRWRWVPQGASTGVMMCSDRGAGWMVEGCEGVHACAVRQGIQGWC